MIDKVVHDALRYLGAKEQDPTAEEQLKRLFEEYSSVFCPRQITAVFNVKTLSPAVTFDNCEAVLEGESIRRFFKDASQAIFSAFTLGIAFDKKVRELSLSHPAESVALNALGSAYAERKADELLMEERNKKHAEGFKTTFRFCPGYGDLPMKTNVMIAAALGASKKIGLTVEESGLLLPMKSIVGVTACVKE